MSTLATPKSSPNSGGVLLLLLSHCEDPKANRRENPTQTAVWSEIRTTGRSIERKRSALPSSFIIFALENATPVNSKTPYFRIFGPGAFGDSSPHELRWTYGLIQVSSTWVGLCNKEDHQSGAEAEVRGQARTRGHWRLMLDV